MKHLTLCGKGDKNYNKKFYLGCDIMAVIMKIKDLPKIERPREKMERYGAEKLTNSELLAILLRSGSKGVNVVELSKRILAKFSGNGLAKASIEELKILSDWVKPRLAKLWLVLNWAKAFARQEILHHTFTQRSLGRIKRHPRQQKRAFRRIFSRQPQSGNKKRNNFRRLAERQPRPPQRSF